ncbi:MAG: hypothetical protein AB7O24_04440 [Kofleriaceae bacterium]
MKPARLELEHRDVKPAIARHGVVITESEVADDARVRRIAEILADILDRAGTPEEGERPWTATKK